MDQPLTLWKLSLFPDEERPLPLLELVLFNEEGKTPLAPALTSVSSPAGVRSGKYVIGIPVTQSDMGSSVVGWIPCRFCLASG